MARPLETAVRATAGLLGAVAVPMACYSVYLALAAGGGAAAPTRVYYGVLALTGLVAGLLAAFVALRGRAGRDTAVFAVFLAAVALAVMEGGRYRLVERLLGDALPTWADGWRTVVFFGAVAAGAAASVRIPQLFPRPLEASAVRSAPGPRRLRALQARLLGPAPAWLGFGVAGWLMLLGVNRWLPGLIVPVTLLFLLAELVTAILYFRVAYRRGDADDRRRIFWFLEAGLITAGALALGFWVELALHVFGARGPVVLWLHGTVIPVGMLATVIVVAMAILYKGALDSRLVVRKTLLYGAVGFTLTALFVGVETLVEELLATRLGFPDRAGAYVAGFLAALVFGPVRSAIERKLPG